MGAGELLRQRALSKGRSLVAKLSRFKIVFTLSSSGYCAIHWLVAHNFSTYMLSGALVFGAMVAMAVAWLSDRFHSSSSASAR
jgi:hypothetical protein